MHYKIYVNILILSLLMVAPWGAALVAQASPRIIESGITACPATLPDYRVLGYADLSDPRSRNVVKARFYCRRDPKSFQEKFVIEPVSPPNAFKPYVYYPKIGQQIFISAHPWENRIHFLVSKWTFSATTEKMMVFRLGNGGEIEVVFDQPARGGFEMVNVSGGELDDIVMAPDHPLDRKQHMNIYSWNGSHFVLTKTVPVAEPHRYAIARTIK